MLYLCKSVMFILLISYGASYGSQDNTYNDEYLNPNQTISYEDHEQSASSNLLNFLSGLLIYYDGVRLPLRAVEIVCLLFNIHLFEIGREPPRNIYTEILSFIFGSSFLFHIIYDISMNIKNHGRSLLLFLPRFIAQTTEHITFVVIVAASCSFCLKPLIFLVKIHTESCPICLEPLRFPFRYARCRRHLFCADCLNQWLAHSPFCPVCRQ